MRSAVCLLLAMTVARAEPGLVARIRDSGHSVTIVTATPNFYLEAGESLHPAIEAAFEAEWSGSLSIVQGGQYHFDRGASLLSIDGKPVASAPVQLDAGSHTIKIQYRRRPGPAALRVSWQSAQFPLEPIPAALFSRTGPAADAKVERGRGLVEELGCVNCHRSSSKSLEGRMGPDLSGAGSRIDAGWLHKWLSDPSAFRAGAVMPSMGDAERHSDIVSYLAQLKEPGGERNTKKIAESDRARGGAIFGALGCTACHQQTGLALDGMGSKTSAAALAEYLKAPQKFDPGGRMPAMLLSDAEAFQLAAYLASSKNPEFERAWQPGDAVRGKSAIESDGCLACHALRDGEVLRNRQIAPRLEALPAKAGCRVARYQWTAEQREAVAAFLAAYRRHPDVAAAPVYDTYRRMEQLRCNACHATESGPASATLPEAAPPLADVGSKLRTNWLSGVLTGRRRSRSWLQLRMPDYDSARVQSMAAALAKAAGVEPGEGKMAASLGEGQRARGAGMIGNDPKSSGLACIGCHDWGTNKSLGEEGPQLIDAARRLRYDWFQRWMLNPARILSGTSMPNYFSSMERAKAQEVIDNLWAALLVGEKLPLPAGLSASKTADAEALPEAGREPVVIRWDMPESTPAAIAVGLPGRISYCFDAGESRLRYAWRGGFLDLSETLVKKVDQRHMTPTAKVIGDVFYRSASYPLRKGDLEREPQRRFRGYRLIEGYPEFHYDVDGTEVFERITVSKDGQGLTRDFTLPHVDAPMWFVGGEVAGGRMEIPQGAGVRFTVSISGGRQ